MLDIDVLLHAVLDDPADDVARLVYADRLDETGVPMNAVRAEFIRLQIAGADIRRQEELTRDWLTDWFGRAVVLAGDSTWAVRTHPDDLVAIWVSVTRGFISTIGTAGVYGGEWTPWTPWRVAEAFADTVIDVFTNHPLEWISADWEVGEEWQIRRSQESTWAAYHRDRDGLQLTCESSVSRTAFTADLHAAIRDWVTTLNAQYFSGTRRTTH